MLLARSGLILCAFTALASGQTPRKDMLVSTGWLAGHLNDAGVAVLHVARDRAHYDAGHVPGARFLPWSELVTTRDGKLNELPPAPALQSLFERLGVSNRTRVILYGEGLGMYASRAWLTLNYLGHGGKSALLDGGFEKWQAEKRPVSKEEPPARQGRFKPHLRTDVVVTLDQMREFSRAATSLPSPGVLILDTRPAGDYNGTTSNPSLPRTGHIPGAKHVYWQQHLASKENPVLRPSEELLRLYTNAGAAKNKTIVTYCQTGVQASQSYFTMKLLGYDVRMYDGSFSEWSRAEGAEVSKPK